MHWIVGGAETDQINVRLCRVYLEHSIADTFGVRLRPDHRVRGVDLDNQDMQGQVYFSEVVGAARRAALYRVVEVIMRETYLRVRFGRLTAGTERGCVILWWLCLRVTCCFLRKSEAGAESLRSGRGGVLLQGNVGPVIRICNTG